MRTLFAEKISKYQSHIFFKLKNSTGMFSLFRGTQIAIERLVKPDITNAPSAGHLASDIADQYLLTKLYIGVYPRRSSQGREQC